MKRYILKSVLEPSHKLAAADRKAQLRAEVLKKVPNQPYTVIDCDIYKTITTKYTQRLYEMYILRKHYKTSSMYASQLSKFFGYEGNVLDLLANIKEAAIELNGLGVSISVHRDEDNYVFNFTNSAKQEEEAKPIMSKYAIMDTQEYKVWRYTIGFDVKEAIEAAANELNVDVNWDAAQGDTSNPVVGGVEIDLSEV